MNRPEQRTDDSVRQGALGADLVACVVISLLYVAASATVGLHGEFPLSDDWTYARTTQHLLETGHLERSTWTWVPMITHAVVGWLFSWEFGFSFETLRLSGVFMGWVGVLGAYVLCRQMGTRIPAALLGAAVMGLNPMHFNLSHTFMMDVPFAAIMTWSLTLLCRGLRNRSWVWISLGTLLAESAVLSRQPGLAIPIALVIVIVAIQPRSARHLLAAGAITAVTVFTHFALPSLIYGPRDSGTMFGFSFLKMSVQDRAVAWHLGTNSVAQFSYLGAFLAPVVLPLVPSRNSLVRLLGGSLVLTILSAVAIQKYGLGMPLGRNLIYDFGVGPATLHGNEHLPQAGAGFWWILTLLGLFTCFVAIGTLMIAAWERRHQIRRRPDGLLLLLVPAIYLPPLLTRSPCFDRYLLPILPPLVALLLLLIRSSRRVFFPGRVLGIAVLALMGVFAIAGTRDYLEHHRCRWRVLNELTERGIDPTEIHGGFEFISTHARNNSMAYNWHEMRGERFVVSLAKSLEGYRAISSSSYQRLLPPGTQVITVLEAVK